MSQESTQTEKISIIKKISKKFSENRNELSQYFIFGVLTTLLNVGLFQTLVYLHLNYMIANLIALVSAKTFAYVTNKFFVFKSQTTHIYDTAAEIIRFGFARGFTGVVDYFGLIFLVEVLSFDAVYSKYFLQIVVIILNYILGKKLVFTKKKQ